MERIKLIVFDLDGTLVDSQEFIVDAIRTAFQSQNLLVPPPEKIITIIGLSLMEAFKRLDKNLTKIQVENLVKAFKNCYSTFSRERVLSPLYPGVRKFLKRLNKEKSLKLAIATGKGKLGLLQILRAHRIEKFFSGFQTSDDNPSKPDPRMLLKLISDFNICPSDALMVGDTDFDIIMAKNAAVDSIAVSWGYHSEQQLIASNPGVVVHDFYELKEEILKKNFLGIS